MLFVKGEEGFLRRFVGGVDCLQLVKYLGRLCFVGKKSV